MMNCTVRVSNWSWAESGCSKRPGPDWQGPKFVLIPASDKTHGHGTHTWPIFWQPYLKELLDESEH